MKKTVKHYLIYVPPTEYSEEHFRLYPLDVSTCSSDYVLIREQDIELDIPDDFDPRPGMIDALEEQRKKATADYQALMTVLDGKIQQLRCIEMKPATD